MYKMYQDTSNVSPILQLPEELLDEVTRLRKIIATDILTHQDNIAHQRTVHTIYHQMGKCKMA